MHFGTILEIPKRKDKFVNQPFLTIGSGFIHMKRFYKKKIQFSHQNIQDTEKMLRNRIVYFKEIYKFATEHFFI